MSNKGDWVAVSRDKPCPACNRPSADHTSRRCSWLRNGRGACCYWVESPYPAGDGWMHWIDASPNGAARTRSPMKPSIVKTVDFQWLTEACCKAATNVRVVALAKELGLTFNAIRDMQWGWDGSTWTVPTRSVDGKIIGVQHRYSDGSKVTDGNGGFFMPASLNGEIPLFVVEGASDTTALRSLGLGVIGTYNVGWNPGGVYKIAAGRPIVIVRDNDARQPKGKIGGRIRIARFYKALRKMRADVTMIVPPGRDARAAIRDGWTKDDILTAAG